MDISTKKELQKLSEKIAWWIYQYNFDLGVCTYEGIEELELEAEFPTLGNSYFRILKYFEGSEDTELSFVHRSMLEYFVANKLYREICDLDQYMDSDALLLPLDTFDKGSYLYRFIANKTYPSELYDLYRKKLEQEMIEQTILKKHTFVFGDDRTGQEPFKWTSTDGAACEFEAHMQILDILFAKDSTLIFADISVEERDTLYQFLLQFRDYGVMSMYRRKLIYRNCDLRNIQIEKVHNIDFMNCNLSGAVFRNLISSGLMGEKCVPELWNCILKGTTFTECDLRRATFKNCSFDDNSRISKCIVGYGLLVNPDVLEMHKQKVIDELQENENFGHINFHSLSNVCSSEEAIAYLSKK